MLLKKSLNLVKKKSAPKEKPLIEKDSKKPRKHIIPGFKKFKETMGNLASTKFHLGQHSIENDEEHAHTMMQQLNRMRQHGEYCDITINRDDGGKYQAHKLVLSYNPTLLELATNAVSTSTNGDGETNTVPKSVESSFENKDSLINELNTNAADTTNASNTRGFENKGFTHSTCDLTNDVEETNLEDNTKEKITQNKDIVINDVEIKVNESNGINEAFKTEDLNVISPEGTKEEEEKQDSELSPPLVSELVPDDKVENIPTTVEETKIFEEEVKTTLEEHVKAEEETKEQQEIPSKSFVTTIELNCLTDSFPSSPSSLSDPIEILVNYLYTAKIDITKKNVGKLRIIARQCAMSEVNNACDEFDNVLRIETGTMVTDEEKDTAASQFRYQFSDTEHLAKILAHFNSMRTHSKYTDVVLTTTTAPPIKMPSHSVLLQAMSPEYFKVKVGVCEAGWSDTETDSLEIQLPELDGQVFKAIVEYFYTAKIGVTTQNVKILLESAKILQIPAITEGCAEYLKGIVNSSNAFEYLRVATTYGCDSLEKFIIKHIKENFKHTVKSPSFLSITSDELVSFTKPDGIALEYPVSETELEVYKAIRAWINHDVGTRKAELNKVMDCVRFELIGERVLVDTVTTDLLVMEDDILCQKIARIVTCKQHKAYDNEVTMRGKPTVLLIGGSSPVDDVTSEDLGYTEIGYSKVIYTYDMRTGKQHEIASMAETRSLHCSIIRDQYLYIIGGFDNFSCMTNSVYCLDLSNGVWCDIPHMKVKRVCFTSFSTQKYLFVVGGLTPSGYTATVERYDRQTGKWKTCSPMPTTSYRHSGCFYEGEYFVSGGHEKQDHVFAYNVEKDEWRKIPPLNFGRDSHVMCTVGDRIYVIGGDGDHIPVEYYESKTERWTVVVPPSPGISGRLYLPGFVRLGKKIYVFGGWCGEDEALEDLMCFNTETDDWEYVNHTMAIPRGSLSANVVNLPTSYNHIKFQDSA